MCLEEGVCLGAAGKAGASVCLGAGVCLRVETGALVCLGADRKVGAGASLGSAGNAGASVCLVETAAGATLLLFAKKEAAAGFRSAKNSAIC